MWYKKAAEGGDRSFEYGGSAASMLRWGQPCGNMLVLCVTERTWISSGDPKTYVKLASVCFLPCSASFEMQS